MSKAKAAGWEEKEFMTNYGFTIGLRLQQSSNPGPQQDFQPSLSCVASEYATRYLEQLGVRASKSALDLVNQHIPLTEKCIKTTIRAKGHVADEIHIQVPSLAHQPRVPQVIGPHAVLQLGLSNQEAGALASEEEASKLAKGLDGKLVEPKEIPGSKFKHMAAKYLHPFHLDTNLARQQLEALRPPMRRTLSATVMAHTTRRPGSVTMQHQTSMAKSLEAGAWDDDVLRQEITEELLQELQVTPEVVLTLVAQLEGALEDWFVNQAPETLKGRLTKEEFMSALELLSDDHSVKFFITLINFMHEEYVRTSPDYPHHLEAKLQSGRPSLLATNNSSSGRNSIARRASFNSMASINRRATQPTFQSSRLQTYEKYDLGYQLWSKEKVASLKAARAAAASHRDTAGPTPFLSKATTRATSRASPMFDDPHEAGPSAGHSNFSRNVSHAAPHDHVGPQPRNSPDPGPLSLPPSLHKESSRGNSVSSPRHATSSPRHAYPTNHDRSNRGSMIQFAPGVGGGEQGAASPARSPSPLDKQVSVGSREWQSPEPQQDPWHSHHGPHSPSNTSHGPHSPSSSHHRGRADAAHEYRGGNQPGSIKLAAPAKAAARSLALLPSMKALSAAASSGAEKIKSLDSSDFEGLQRARLFVLQKEFGSLYNAQRSTRAGLFFVLPIFLVACRLLVYTGFTCLFSLWCQTAEGAQALEMMDAAIVHLFDPHGYLGRALSILQSSPSAVSIVSKHPHQSHEPGRVHYADVSPLMRTAMEEPRSAEARRLLLQARKDKAARVKRAHTARSGPSTNAALASADVSTGAAAAKGPLKTALTKAQQEELYREAFNALFVAPSDPLYVSRGEPVEYTTRDSWVPRQY